MTGTTSSSSSSQLPPSVAADSPEFGEEAADVVRSSQSPISLLRPPFSSTQAPRTRQTRRRDLQKLNMLKRYRQQSLRFISDKMAV
ncbi:hypothetical protein L3X38_027294 [Prunus dulcis]|uniref:Uncharacterized protein n=1 Tax=Prunus dulcis TaxID=3755 RepID=A0AAD4VNW8_PRUDU|nr:hypothetical protein L3X38_027294 [Prunus dulcis]